MAKPTPLKDALKALEAKEEMPKEEMENVKLYGFMPPIAKLDASLSTLKKCKKLSLSTNTIDKITSVSGMDRSVAAVAARLPCRRHAHLWPRGHPPGPPEIAPARVASGAPHRNRAVRPEP
jgi:Leucine-rich repeat (LRR) protein